MENEKFVVRPRLERRLLEDLVALHSKVGKDTDTKITRAADIVLLVMGIVMIVDAAVMFALNGVTGTFVLTLLVGAAALVLFAFRRRFAARRMQRNSEKYSQNQTTTVDDDGIRVASGSAEASYRYDAVEAIYRWRGAYVLYVDKVHIIPLPFADFVEGSPDAFPAYITEKTGLPVQTLSDKKNKER
jgi:hypothetical protein